MILECLVTATREGGPNGGEGETKLMLTIPIEEWGEYVGLAGRTEGAAGVRENE